MRALTPAEREQIVDYDMEHHRMLANVNRTRFYNFIVAQDGDAEVRTVAAKVDKRGVTRVKEVIRTSARHGKLRVRDLAYGTMCGYLVDWSPEKNGPVRSWNHGREGFWGSEPYDAKRPLWKVRCPTVNPEALESTLWRWSGYSDACNTVTLIDFLRTYLDHPKMELLAKSGLWWLTDRRGFLRRAETDKRFLRYVASNAEAIKAHYAKVPTIYRAYRDGITIESACRRGANLRKYGAIAALVDVDRAEQYVMGRKDVGVGAYCLYVQHCAALGLDLGDTKVCAPKNFKARARVMADRAAEQARKLDAELTATMNAQLAARAQQWGRLETLRGALVVKLPRGEGDLRAEGAALGHCVGGQGYASRIARGESVIAFVRLAADPSTPYATAEYRPATRTVTQCYASNNSRPSKAVLDFVNGRLTAAANQVSRRAAI